MACYSIHQMSLCIQIPVWLNLSIPLLPNNKTGELVEYTSGFDHEMMVFGQPKEKEGEA